MYIRVRLPLWLVTFRVDVARAPRPVAGSHLHRRGARSDEIAARVDAAREAALREYALRGRRTP